MKHKKTMGFISVLLFIMLLAGCNAQTPQAEPTIPAPTLQSPQAEPTCVQESPEPEKSDMGAKEATWVIEIDDTQQITDEMGLVWNYRLFIYASKAGGKDVLGNYTGDIVLDMEPDFESAKALAAKEGADLLSMLFKHHSQANNISFEVVAYSPETYAQLMKENIPDNPLLQVNNYTDSIYGLAITRITFETTQEPIDWTISDEEGIYSGTIPGGATTVNVPMEITMDGATVFCHIFQTVHPLDRSFKGVVTGDVID